MVLVGTLGNGSSLVLWLLALNIGLELDNSDHLLMIMITLLTIIMMILIMTTLLRSANTEYPDISREDGYILDIKCEFLGL